MRNATSLTATSAPAGAGILRRENALHHLVEHTTVEVVVIHWAVRTEVAA